MENLEESVRDMYKELNVEPEMQQAFFELLAKLKDHSPETYSHCLRVGLLAVKIAEHEEVEDKRPLLLGGTMHDIGKLVVGEELLGAKKMMPYQYEAIKIHAKAGMNLIADHYVVTASIIGLHHRFKTNGYGASLNKAAVPSAAFYELVKDRSIIVSLADFYDAFFYRKNKFCVDKTNPAEVRAFFLEHFPRQEKRVDYLIQMRFKGATSSGSQASQASSR
jgi:response regulator RpfG family c-di-GMP phosphodiesterase